MVANQEILDVAKELASSIQTGSQLYDACVKKAADPRTLFICDIENYFEPSNALVDVFLEKEPDLIRSFLNLAKENGHPFSKEQLEQMVCHVLLHGEDAIKYKKSNRTEVRRFEKSFQAANAIQAYLRENYDALSPQDIAGSYQKHCSRAFQKSPHYRPNLLEIIVDKSIKSDFLNSQEFREFFDTGFTAQDFLRREETLDFIIENGFFEKVNTYLQSNNQSTINFLPILKQKIKDCFIRLEARLRDMNPMMKVDHGKNEIIDEACQFIDELQIHLEQYNDPDIMEEVRGLYKEHPCPYLAEVLLQKRIKDGTDLRYIGIFRQDGYKKADFLRPNILALVFQNQRLEQVNNYLENHGDATIESNEFIPLVIEEIAEKLTKKFSTAQELFDACIEKAADPRDFFSCDVSWYKSPYNRLTDALLEEKAKIILDYLNLCKRNGFPFPRETISKMMCHALLHGDAVIKGQQGSYRDNYRDFEVLFQSADALQDYLREHDTPVTLQELRTLHQETCPESTAHVDLSEKVLDAAIRGQFLNERYFTDFFKEQPYKSGDFTKREETLAAIVHSGYFEEVNRYLKSHNLEPVDFVPLLQPNIKSYVLDEKLLKHVTAYLDTTGQPLTVQFIRDSLGQDNVPLSAVFKEAFSERGQDRTGTLSEKQITQIFSIVTKNGDTVDLDDLYFGVKEPLWGGSSADHNKTLFDTVGGAETILKDNDCLTQLTRDPNAVLFLQKVWASVPEDQHEALQNIYANVFNSAFTAQALEQRGMFSASSR